MAARVKLDNICKSYLLKFTATSNRTIMFHFSSKHLASNVSNGICVLTLISPALPAGLIDELRAIFIRLESLKVACILHISIH